MSKEECCYFCHNTVIARHEIYHGANRQKSKALGLWINLCPTHHNEVHNYSDVDLSLKKQCQIVAKEAYGWTDEEFIQKIGKNYL